MTTPQKPPIPPSEIVRAVSGNLRGLKPLSEGEYQWISENVRQFAGINLGEGKRELVHARLGKRIRELGLSGYKAYLNHVREDRTGNEMTLMIEMLTTNVTFLFRERNHFDYFAKQVVAPARAARKQDLRVWCAGCSTGEEAYTLAITLLEAWPEAALNGALILATDLSSQVLATAQRGVYHREKLKECPPHLLEKHFRREGRLHYSAAPALRSLIRFRRLNFMDPWPFKRQFDTIFCRNVMIYFNEETQAQLVSRFYGGLAPGGYLFIGHSESLTRIRHQFTYAQPSVYKK